MRRLVVALVLTAAVASAQEEAPEAYRGLVTAAVEEFGAGRLPEARALFRQAHAAYPNARTLRGIGLVSMEMRDYAEAYRALSAALVDARLPLSEGQGTEARQILERIRRFVGIYRLEVRPAEASVEVDGVVVEPGEPLIVGLGRHRVRVTAPGHEAAERRWDVHGGEDRQETIALEPEPVAAADVETGAEPRPPPMVAPAPSSGPTPVGLGLVIGGGAFALTSVALGLGWWLPAQQQADLCTPRERCLNADEVFGARDAAIGVTLTFAGLGLAALVTGAIVEASR